MLRAAFDSRTGCMLAAGRQKEAGP